MLRHQLTVPRRQNNRPHLDDEYRSLLGVIADDRSEPGGTGRCGNTVVIAGVDGATYTYCHLSAVAVNTNDQVEAGQAIGLSGGRPGAPGAGNTTGPHLHLSIRAYGQEVCPQPVLLGILRGTPVPPTAAPSTGCFTPGTSTDWSSWLDQSLARMNRSDAQAAFR